MKKRILAGFLYLFFSVSPAYAACTAQDFQALVVDLQTSMTSLSHDPAKLAAANAAIEKEFQSEMLEFATMADSAAGDPAKMQAMLDKGCDLYGRINKRMSDFR